LPLCGPPAHCPTPSAFPAPLAVARALGAARTPHVFVLDSEHRLAYRGAPDSDHTDEAQNAAWLRAALDAVLAGETPERAETPARGCSVKWRS
jgi:sensor domain CHASE-containing protein